MRSTALIPLALLAGCGPLSSADNAATATPVNASTAPDGKRGDERADSASAQDARAIVERYFALLTKHDYAAAYRLWGHGGKDAGGSAEAFADSFADYAKFEPQVGDPTEIHAREGMQYILVTARAHVESRKTGKAGEREGTVALRRSVDPADPDADKRDWRIWSVDLRARH